MALKLITPPANPVSLTEAKAHLRVTHALEDGLIGVYLAAALEEVETHIEQAVGTQTLEWSADAFPPGEIELPMPPLQSVTSVKYRDANGAEQTLAGAAYAVDAVSSPGRVVPVDSWPATDVVPNAVTVRFVAGYSTAPAVVKAAILLLTSDLYHNREAAADKALLANPAISRLLFPLRMLRV